MTSLLQDLRFSVRGIRRHPLYAIASVCSLALGIGANSATFSVLNASLFRQLPYPDPSALVLVGRESFSDGEKSLRWSYPRYLDIRAGGRPLAEVSAFRSLFVTLERQESQQIEAELISENYFVVLGVSATTALSTGEERALGGRSVAIAYELWQEMFSGRHNVLGEPLMLNGQSFVITRVMPRGFRGQSDRVTVWLPIESASIITGDPASLSAFSWSLHVLARLPRGAGANAASLSALARQMGSSSDGKAPQWGIHLVSLTDARFPGPARRALLMLWAVAAAVTLLACVNVANLNLVRAAARRNELATRVALGASARRLLQQAMIEACLVSLSGGVLGLVVMIGAQHTLWRLRPQILDGAAGGIESISAPVVLYSAALALAAGVLTSLLVVRSSLRDAAKHAPWMASARIASGEGRLFQGGDPRGILAIAQLSLAFALLVIAAQLTSTVRRLTTNDLTFRTRSVLTGRVELTARRYTDERARTFYSELVERLAAIPGVLGASVDGALPLEGAARNTAMTISDDRPRGLGGPGTAIGYHTVATDHFRALGIPIAAGRSFQESDMRAPVVVGIVSATAVDKFWHGKSPVGQRISSMLLLNRGGWREVEIVGVAGDVKHGTPESLPGAEIYVPVEQDPPVRAAFIIQTALADPLLVAPSVRKLIQEMDRSLAVTDVQSMEMRVWHATAPARFSAALCGLYAGIALILAIVGVYAVVAFSVTQRTREFGIRVALGARRIEVLSLVLRGGAKLALVGVGVGTALTVAAAQLIANQLYGVSPFAPSIYLQVGGLVLVLTVAASALPALRATKVDAMRALSAD